jgi:predicted Fe-Mo cluster-binding NifX family protein
MKIALTSVGESMDSEIDPRFGRAAFFLIVNPETMAHQFLRNLNTEGRGGVGIQSAQMIIQEGVEAVITGKCGPNAFETLTAANLEIYEGITGSVRTAIEDFKNKKLQKSQVFLTNQQKFSKAGKSTKKNRNQINLGHFDDGENDIPLIKEKIADIDRRIVELNARLQKMSEKRK